jgi:hypothetical protein
MATITDYPSLQTEIANELDRPDSPVLNAIPLWVQLAEADINQKLRHFKMVCQCTAVGHENDPIVRLPDNWLEARNVEVNGCQVTYQSPDVLDLLRIRAAQSVAPPTASPTTESSARPPLAKFYTFYDSNLEIWPTPTADYTVTMQYYKTLPPLDSALDGRNWLLDISPLVYFYGSLVHSAPFLRDDGRVALWAGMYDAALVILDKSSRKAMTSGSRISRLASVSM